MNTTNSEEIRSMIFDFAHRVARRCVDSVIDHGLTLGQIDEEFEVSDTKWHVHVVFDTKPGIVQIQAHPQRETMTIAEAMGLVAPEGFFHFTIPVEWVPE